MTQFHVLDHLVNLHDGYRKSFRIDQHKLLLLVEDNNYHIIENECPHAGSAFDSGLIRNQTISCPGHFMQFDLATGQCLERKSTCRAIKVYDPVFEGNSLGVML